MIPTPIPITMVRSIMIDEADGESDDQYYKEPARGVSEDIAGTMDIDY
jgi:hypothetical protein